MIGNRYSSSYQTVKSTRSKFTNKLKYKWSFNVETPSSYLNNKYNTATKNQPRKFQNYEVSCSMMIIVTTAFFLKVKPMFKVNLVPIHAGKNCRLQV